MLEAAECHIALQELPDARSLIDRASADIDRMRESSQAAEKQEAERWHEKVTELRSLIDGKADTQN